MGNQKVKLIQITRYCIDNQHIIGMTTKGGQM